jgi:hypothetical protein
MHWSLSGWGYFTIENREAEAYDEVKVMALMVDKGQKHCYCSS